LLLVPQDLGDRELKVLRNGRWEKAFIGADTSSFGLHCNAEGDDEAPVEATNIRVNRKATIVIEHLIQAADVAHMSQHWNIYRKWNEWYENQSLETHVHLVFLMMSGSLLFLQPLQGDV
jgi:hypothetical protein